MDATHAWEVLDPDTFAEVLLAVGYATGAAMQKDDILRAEQFLRLANKINLGNPNYRPYEVPEAKQHA